MIEFVSQEGKKNLILFVHGFCGGEATWQNGKSRSFPELLSDDFEISENYDIAHFSYFTKLLNLFAKASNISSLVKRMFGTSHGKLANNISIEEIGNLLRTEIRFKLQKYDNIIVIAHSMGGLVTKSSIIKDIEERTPSKIKLFISLAVPHQGAEAATFGKLMSDNLQIEGLSPLNEYIHKINDEWQKTSLRPTTKYFYGVHDSVVKKTSAVPIDKEKSDAISVDEDHTSITKPNNLDSTTIIAVKQIILCFGNNDPGMSTLEFKQLEDETDFDDELFVLKLISADIHNTAIREAKEAFLNAEYIRKLFSSSSDQKRLSELYTKIRKVYQNSYTKYMHDGIPNSGLLLSDVHDTIIKEDNNFLGTFIIFINAIHKQGMLHQLANSEGENIWWVKDGSIASLRHLLTEDKSE
ncbi:ABC-three component system protein [Halomonas sp. YLGW01]|uniref:ABC-three component system protein n=1 Tax=Halomonas sp. YLGW01 TaxID=2773308 RepID=UPI0017856F80|nr:ABC-three component system protein [Halomonas sp. YLGW01]